MKTSLRLNPTRTPTLSRTRNRALEQKAKNAVAHSFLKDVEENSDLRIRSVSVTVPRRSGLPGSSEAAMARHHGFLRTNLVAHVEDGNRIKETIDWLPTAKDKALKGG